MHISKESHLVEDTRELYCSRTFSRKKFLICLKKMRIILFTLFFNLAIFLNFIELSSQSFPRRQEPHPLLPDISYYEDENGLLQEVHGQIRSAFLSDFIIGIVHNGVLCKIYNRHRQDVAVHRPDMVNVQLEDHHRQIIRLGETLPQHGVAVASFTFNFP